MHLERSRVHRHENIQVVAWGDDVDVGEVHLEAGDAVEAALRSTDLGRVVGKGHDVVALAGCVGAKTAPCELHPVAGVSCEAHDDPADLLGHP